MKHLEMFAVAVFLAVVIAAPQASSQIIGRSGPADNPERYPDYGGTPDAALFTDLGLSTDEVRTLLKAVTSSDYETRIKAALDLGRFASGSEPSLKEVLWDNHGARNSQIRQSLNIARKNLENSSDTSGSLLKELLKMNPDNKDNGPGTKAAMRVMSMLVALHNLNSMAGYKIMLDFSPRHAGAFRHEIGRMFTTRGFDALPALVYGRGSKNSQLHMFAVKWIRDMGNPLLGEQVRSIKNPRRLAQLLEAYASVNELDAIDVTLSLTKHKSVFVREAARKCLTSFGKNAKWQIRRMFENTFGEEPADDTDFKQWSDALYRHFDIKLNAEAMDVFREGRDAQAAGNLDLMSKKFKQVLQGMPLFIKRNEMAKGFLLYGEYLEENEKLQQAKDAILMAIRVAKPGSAELVAARARLDWMTAEENRKGGVLDATLYRRVAKAAPGIEGAVEIVNDIDAAKTGGGNYLKKATLVSVFLFIAMMLTYLRLRS